MGARSMRWVHLRVSADGARQLLPRRAPGSYPARTIAGGHDMEWRKASESLKSAFEEALPDDPRVERKQMFGYPCAFVNGNMFAGVHQEALFLRLGEQERATLLDQPGSGPFEPMPGRAMREYVVAP